MQLEKDKLAELERHYKLNLINSISGIKPANLVGTVSKNGQENVAIFSSVVHIGSNPPQLGIIFRPQEEIPRDTYRNIMETGFYTVNHVTTSIIEKAHYTSAKLKPEESEFDRMKLNSEKIADFQAPFVGESVIKMGLKYVESVFLTNGCIFVIGTVELLVVPDEAVNELGQIDLEISESAGVSGLNTYYKLVKKDSFPYVRSNEIPNFE